MNKLQYIHTVESYAATKTKNEEDRHEMTWRDFQDTLSSEQNKVQNGIYSMLPFM